MEVPENCPPGPQQLPQQLRYDHFDILVSVSGKSLAISES